MESAYCCPSCFEVFNEKDKIPRNLPCGHTYCEGCLIKIREVKAGIECPICRKKLPREVLPSSLSKNYIAADLALKYRETENKLQMCPDHSEPLQIYCETDKKNICVRCLIDHSGHPFIKQEHSSKK